MLQTFSAATHPNQGPPRVSQLREWMEENSVDAFLVPRADKHQGEYVAPQDERLAWLTGFTGSAGFAIILKDQAAIFVDGRYTVQVAAQTDEATFDYVGWPQTSLADWLGTLETPPRALAYDPWLHTVAELSDLEKNISSLDIALHPTENGVDAIWADRPKAQIAQAVAQPIEFSGESSVSKRERLGGTLREAGQDYAVLTLPDSICWLLNIRGTDIARTPIVQAFAVLCGNGRVSLFSDISKFKDLGPDPGIDLYPWSEFEPHLQTLSGTVRVDRTSAPVAVQSALSCGSATIVYDTDPCVFPKARKNAIELDGSRKAHIRDGAAVCEFLAWFDEQDKSKLTEIDIVQSLESFRRATGVLRDISFETIAGSGPHGAIVHYRVTDDTNRTLDEDSLLLIDSGGQYQDGTTDITRTLPLGTPTREMREAYTRVLKGMIAVSKLNFPVGSTGREIDPIARQALWSAGQDYAHGTGHGVGSFLSVHEGPQRISKASNVAFEPGMIVSNEPGYYREGSFGIRIENLVVARRADDQFEQDMLSFETLTLAPIATDLIIKDMLSADETNWLNAYHARVHDTLAPLVTGGTAKWLRNNTQPI